MHLYFTCDLSHGSDMEFPTCGICQHSKYFGFWSISDFQIRGVQPNLRFFYSYFITFHSTQSLLYPSTKPSYLAIAVAFRSCRHSNTFPKHFSEPVITRAQDRSDGRMEQGRPKARQPCLLTLKLPSPFHGLSFWIQEAPGHIVASTGLLAHSLKTAEQRTPSGAEWSRHTSPLSVTTLQLLHSTENSAEMHRTFFLRG